MVGESKHGAIVTLVADQVLVGAGVACNKHTYFKGSDKTIPNMEMILLFTAKMLRLMGIAVDVYCFRSHTFA